MPKENKHSRGRREEKKRKRDNGEEDESAAPKRQKSQDPEDVVFLGTDNAEGIEGEEGEGGGGVDRPYYGQLEDEEQEYFRHADQLLELNDFPSDEDRSLFLANVYREAEGKELKIACSQSCSRLMERLIILSTADQKKKLFEKFNGNFAHLIQHRFASHCCEMLFIQSATVVTEELTADSKDMVVPEGEVYVSMENLFLYTLNELEGKMTFLLTDRFASHALRVLLVILSGRPLEVTATKTMLQSKKKEKITITGHSTAPTEFTLSKRAVPSSFDYAIDKIVTDTIATMETSFIHILATHPTGNPTLQLLLELELSNPNTKKGANSEQKTILATMLPDDITVEGSQSAIFINGILYDAIGSRLLETIMTHAPGKLFKQFYRTIFKDRIAGLARNEISSYVVIRVLNRLSKEDLEHAVEQIHPQILGLVERRRTVVIKTLLERCYARGADSTKIVDAIESSYGSDPKTLVQKMAAIDDIDHLVSTMLISSETEAAEQSEEIKAAPANLPPKASASQLHGSLLAQAMLTIPGASSALIQSSLLALPQSQLLTLSLWTTTSHIIQTALSSTLDIAFRRKLINSFLFTSDPNTQPLLQLALSSTGSHVLDSLLTSTTSPTPNSTAAPLFSLTERIATTLCTYESELRDSWTGRIVWRNWSLDMFKRKRGDWVKKVKEIGTTAAAEASASRVLPAEVEEQDIDESGAPKKKKKNKKDKRGKKEEAASNEPPKSAIQRAREKFAAGKKAGGNKTFGKGDSKFQTGANAVSVESK